LNFSPMRFGVCCGTNRGRRVFRAKGTIGMPGSYSPTQPSAGRKTGSKWCSIAKCPGKLGPTNRSGLCADHRRMTAYCVRCAVRIKEDCERCEPCHLRYRAEMAARGVELDDE
jgi:hypothetical protein